jgi:hypothetical protein
MFFFKYFFPPSHALIMHTLAESALLCFGSFSVPRNNNETTTQTTPLHNRFNKFRALGRLLVCAFRLFILLKSLSLQAATWFSIFLMALI